MALDEPQLARELVSAMRSGLTLQGAEGIAEFAPIEGFAGLGRELLDVRPVGVEQSNSSMIVGFRILAPSSGSARGAAWLRGVATDSPSTVCWRRSAMSARRQSSSKSTSGASALAMPMLAPIVLMALAQPRWGATGADGTASQVGSLVVMLDALIVDDARGQHVAHVKLAGEAPGLGGRGGQALLGRLDLRRHPRAAARQTSRHS